MSAFTLDTSGFVPKPGPDPMSWMTPHHWGWNALDPFTQGYIEALLTAFWNTVLYATRIKPRGFRDLAPETLAAILKDCADPPKFMTSGAQLWEMRQLNNLARFPPLTPYLGVDGKVYLRPEKTARPGLSTCMPRKDS